MNCPNCGAPIDSALDEHAASVSVDAFMAGFLHAREGYNGETASQPQVEHAESQAKRYAADPAAW